ncbi:MAG: signal peptidase II, partial [Muribaculaceae bacterium]|nr:signal peptidase II [Muribaculaceae bacterium]
WVPGIGGSEFEFFQYIFNIADSSICVGVAMLILFYSREASEAWKTLVVKDKK